MNKMIPLLFGEHWVFRIVYGVTCLMDQLIQVSLKRRALGTGIILAASVLRGRTEEQPTERIYSSADHDYKAHPRRFLPGVY